MIERQYPHIEKAWHSTVRELAYKSKNIGALRWGVCCAYPDTLSIEIDDALLDTGLHLGMSSYTKMRWGRFLRRYFRPDLKDWVHESIGKLTRWPNRPFVSGYSVNLNEPARKVGVGSHGGHNYGGCLASLQIKVWPKPKVILYSRATQLDKIGFLDLALIHLVAKEMLGPKIKEVSAQWVISLCFISAVSQVYYVQRFKQPLKGHILEKRISHLSGKDYEQCKYGSLKRSLKRGMQLEEFGEIPRSLPVKDLSLEFKI